MKRIWYQKGLVIITITFPIPTIVVPLNEIEVLLTVTYLPISQKVKNNKKSWNLGEDK